MPALQALIGEKAPARNQKNHPFICVLLAGNDEAISTAEMSLEPILFCQDEWRLSGNRQ